MAAPSGGNRAAAVCGLNGHLCLDPRHRRGLQLVAQYLRRQRRGPQFLTGRGHAPQSAGGERAGACARGRAAEKRKSAAALRALSITGWKSGPAPHRNPVDRLGSWSACGTGAGAGQWPSAPAPGARGIARRPGAQADSERNERGRGGGGSARLFLIRAVEVHGLLSVHGVAVDAQQRGLPWRRRGGETGRVWCGLTRGFRGRPSAHRESTSPPSGQCHLPLSLPPYPSPRRRSP